MKLVISLVLVAIFLALHLQPFGSLPEPGTMLAIVTLNEGNISKEIVPLPVLPQGHILVKVKYAPVNPSDIYFALGSYNLPGSPQKNFPHLNGLEGMGVVVASNGGFLGSIYALLNLRVSFTAGGGGSWSEYVVVDPMTVVPLPSSISDQGGAAAIVNPLTVIGFLNKAKNHTALVHTAANSALGLMLLRVAPSANLTIVCVVRGEKNRDDLVKNHNHPAHLVIRSDLPDFSAELKKAVELTGATIAFDAVGGQSVSKVFAAMPAKSETYLYGGLSGEPTPDDFKTTGTKIASGFHLKTWIEEGGLPRMIKAMGSMLSMLNNELSTTFQKVVDLKDDSVIDVLHDYFKHQKGGKVLLKL